MSSPPRRPWVYALKRYHEKLVATGLADIVIGTAFFNIFAVALLVWFVVSVTFIESGFWAGVLDAGRRQAHRERRHHAQQDHRRREQRQRRRERSDDRADGDRVDAAHREVEERPCDEGDRGD